MDYLSLASHLHGLSCRGGDLAQYTTEPPIMFETHNYLHKSVVHLAAFELKSLVFFPNLHKMIKILFLSIIVYSRRLFYYDQPVFQDSVCYPVYYREYLPQSEFKPTGVAIADVTDQKSNRVSKNGIIVQSEDGQIVVIDTMSFKTRVLHAGENRYFANLYPIDPTTGSILSVQEYPSTLFQYDFQTNTNTSLLLSINKDAKFQHMTPESIRLRGVCMVKFGSKSYILASRNLDSRIFVYEYGESLSNSTLIGEFTPPGGSELSSMTVYNNYLWFLYSDDSNLISLDLSIIEQTIEMFEDGKDYLDLSAEESTYRLSLSQIGYNSIVFNNGRVYLGFVPRSKLLKNDVHRYAILDFFKCFGPSNVDLSIFE